MVVARAERSHLSIDSKGQEGELRLPRVYLLLSPSAPPNGGSSGGSCGAACQP
jgi:hypothetical protein